MVLPCFSAVLLLSVQGLAVLLGLAGGMGTMVIVTICENQGLDYVM